MMSLSPAIETIHHEHGLVMSLYYSLRGDDTFYHVVVAYVIVNGYVITFYSTGSHFSHPHTTRV